MMRNVKMRQRVVALMKERCRLERENLAIRDMTKGSVIKHYKKCGRKRCVCREGNLHGPYWYLSYKDEDKSVLNYIDKKDLRKTSRLAANYKKFQSNITKINRLNKEVGKLMADIRQILVRRGKPIYISS